MIFMGLIMAAATQGQLIALPRRFKLMCRHCCGRCVRFLAAR
jgi:hypothetical protein